MCSSEKVSAFAVQTPIRLFCLVSRDLRPQKICSKNKCVVIWDTEMVNCNDMQTQISSFVLVFLMLLVRYGGTSVWLLKQLFLWLFFPLLSVWWAKIQILVDSLKELMKIVMYMFAKVLLSGKRPFFGHQGPHSCTTLGSDSPPYTSPVFCPTCQNPSPALCKSFLLRHSSAFATSWNLCLND